MPPKAPIGVTRARADLPNGATSTPPTRPARSARSNRRSISSPTIKSQLPALKLSWGKTADTIVNNGHTIQLNFAEGSTLKLGDTTYKLLQVHFHRPSEHLIGGKSFPMEAHFVHRADSGGLAVVGVMFSEGKPNATFGKIVATMPAKEGPAVKADAAINPNGLLPAKLGYYRYPGSLTTPPCSEVVEWLVLTDPIQVAASRCRGFRKTLSDECAPGAEGQSPLRAAVELSGRLPVSPCGRQVTHSQRIGTRRMRGLSPLRALLDPRALHAVRHLLSQGDDGESYALRASAPSIMSTAFCTPYTATNEPKRGPFSWPSSTW